MMELQDFMRVKITQVEMMRDRGYEISDEEKYLLEDIPMETKFQTFKGFYTQLAESNGYSIRNAMSKLYFHDDDKVYVYYINDTRGARKLNVDTEVVGNFINIICSMSYKNSILIHRSDFTPKAKSSISTVTSDYHIQVFNDSELNLNITKHFMTQKHVLLNESEKYELLKKVDRKTLPIILESDSVIKYLGIREGSIVKIYRKQVFPSSCPIAETLVYKIVKL